MHAELSRLLLLPSPSWRSDARWIFFSLDLFNIPNVQLHEIFSLQAVEMSRRVSVGDMGIFK